MFVSMHMTCMVVDYCCKYSLIVAVASPCTKFWIYEGTVYIWYLNLNRCAACPAQSAQNVPESSSPSISQFEMPFKHSIVKPTIDMRLQSYVDEHLQDKNLGDILSGALSDIYTRGWQLDNLNILATYTPLIYPRICHPPSILQTVHGPGKDYFI